MAEVRTFKKELAPISARLRARAMYWTRNLMPRGCTFLIVDGPWRQAMVDNPLVPQCPYISMTSAAAMHW